MRVILHYGDSGWTGRARFVVDAALLLMERGARVAVTCPLDSMAEQRFGQVGGLTVRPLNADGSWMDLGRRMRRVLRELFSEVVLVHTAREHLMVASALRSEGRGAVLRRLAPVGGATGAGGDIAGAQLWQPEGAWMERVAAYMASSGFMVSSEDDLRALQLPRRPLPPALVPLGVDAAALEEVAPLSNDALGVPMAARKLVCVMGAEARARAGTVLRTISLLTERHPTLHLLLVGPASDHEDLRMHAAALGIIHRVRFLGDRDDSHRVLAAADIGWVVAEGDAEAYGTLDLMAFATPVVAERGPVVASYVADGITGILLPPADPPASAAAIATLLADGEGRVTMGRAGRTRVLRDFDVAPMGDALLAAVSAARDRGKWRRS